MNNAIDKDHPLAHGFCSHGVHMAHHCDSCEVSSASRPTDSKDFKNFHRALCERFGYTHDERDWRRDQVSLIEHVAKQVAPPPVLPADLVALRDKVVSEAHFVSEHGPRALLDAVDAYAAGTAAAAKAAVSTSETPVASVPLPDQETRIALLMLACLGLRNVIEDFELDEATHEEWRRFSEFVIPMMPERATDGETVLQLTRTIPFLRLVGSADTPNASAGASLGPTNS